MQLSLDSNQGNYYITAYSEKCVTINNMPITHSLIVSPAQLIQPWRPSCIEDLQLDDLAIILELKPEVVLLGTGEILQFPNVAIISLFYAANIGIEIMNTGAACRTFDVLVSEGRQVVAALII